MKVYVLVLGSYSDKRIAGIFVDEAKAEKVADAIRKWSSYDDEVNPIMKFDTADDMYDVSNPIFDEKKGGFGSYRVYVYGDGFAEVDEEPGIFNPSVIWDGFTYEVCVLAKDEDTAKKIAFDKISEYKYRMGVEEAK